MKKFLKLAAIVCIAGATTWFAPSAKAASCFPGLPACASTDGTACSTENAFERCVAPGYCESGGCHCHNHVWTCAY